MKNLKIWVKMAAGLGTIILLIIILSVLSSTLLKRVDKETEALKDEYLPLQDIATQLNSNILRVPALMNDYLLTGKPVGLTFEDIDAYAKQPGFAIDPQPLRESAAPLDTPDDFRTFFEQLAAGDDPLRAKRLQLTKLTNQYTDGHSAERVAAFLAERLREREHT